MIFSINHPFTEVISDRMEMLMLAGHNSNFFVSKSELYNYRIQFNMETPTTSLIIPILRNKRTLFYSFHLLFTRIVLSSSGGRRREEKFPPNEITRYGNWIYKCCWWMEDKDAEDFAELLYSIFSSIISHWVQVLQWSIQFAKNGAKTKTNR